MSTFNISVHIGNQPQAPFLSQEWVKYLTYPEIQKYGSAPLTAQELREMIETFISESDLHDDDGVEILTLSPIVLNTIRVLKKKFPYDYHVIAHFDGISCEVDSDGRMEHFPSEFDVHGELLKELM